MGELIDVLKRIVELLYQEERNQAYDLLIKCLPVMGVCIGEIEDQDLQKEIMGALEEAIHAMEESDYTLLADIMQYDIIEKLEVLGEE